MSLRKLHNSRAVFTASLVLCLAQAVRADMFVRPDIVIDPTPERFSVCHGYGCKNLALLALSAQQWHNIRAAFAPAASDPSEERRQIAEALARFET
ncbi:MAG: hypothetical protein ACREUA_05740, partial [Burkholderiales bacterium]